ncbi:MAG: fibronectin type III domain-containing protein [Bacteroidaceae bacterium]|nr:fibronectin type III domain-containing protein [Bacteroidaceae bacterium]
MKVEFDADGSGYYPFYFGFSKTTNDPNEFKWETGQMTDGWRHYEFEAPEGTKYIAIHCNRGTNDIDNFNITTNYNIAPKEFTVIEQNPLNATLAWAAPETSSNILGYRYQYKKTGDEEWSDEQTVSNLTITLNGLSPDTSYDFRVYAIYEDNTYSKYLNGSFHTTPLPQPDQLYVTDLTDQTATVSWTAPASEFTLTGYTYQFQIYGDSDWSAATNVGVTTTTASFSGMTANKYYQFRVKAHYVEGDSPFATFYFSTPEVWELPFECGFENGLKGLAMLDTYYETGISDSGNSRPEAQLDGDHAFLFHFHLSGQSPQYLMSQLLPQNVVKKLTFYYRTNGMGYHERFQVGYSTTSNNPATFTWEPEVETLEFEQYTKYEMIAPADARYVAIRYLTNDKFGVLIDNLSIDAYSDKAAPTHLTATDLVDQLATQITWSAPNASFTDYAYQYKKAVEDTWSDLTPTTATTVTLSGLTVNTDYQFRVKARYADGTSSNFETVFFESDGGIQSLPYEWGFEGGLDGFRVVNNVHDTRYVNFTWHQGNHAFRFSPTNGSLGGYQSTPQYLISPQFDCESTMKVSFYYQIGDDEDYFLPAAFQMGYSTKSNAIDDFQWLNREDITNLGWQQYVCYFPEGTKFVAIKWLPGGYFLMLDDFRFEGTTYLHLADNADNTTAISNKDGRISCDVYLDGRTLYRDGDWNTLCVPFTLNSFSGTPLDGFVVKELDTESISGGHATGLENGTLYLNFKDATAILPGRPYIVKYEGPVGADASHLTYHAQRGSDAQSGSDYFNLVDGNPDTKWYTHYYEQTKDEQTNDRWFCDFTTSNPLSITGYTLIPGSGMQDNPDRAPRTWTLKAKANENDEWILIDLRNVSENSTDAMSINDNTPTSYAIDADKQGIYQFFRLEVYNTGGEYIQLAELTLQGTIASGGVADITNPVFEGVTVNAVAPASVTFNGGRFVGTYNPVVLAVDDKSCLFLGAANTLYYPSDSNNADGNYHLNACRAYFQLDGNEDGESHIKSFVLNFGDYATGIASLSTESGGQGKAANGWFTLDGRKLEGKPTAKGLYIHRGMKVVVNP